MGPALAPVFPPNNSAKSSHLNSISTPRVMLLTKGEKVWESQDLSFMSIQLRAFSYPPVLLSFQIFKFDFWIPHWFSMLFLALPTLFLWFSHFKDQLIACATWTTCPPLPYFWVKCLFSLFTNPLSTWMSPQSHPSKAICKPHILFSFLTLANPSWWLLCGLYAAWMFSGLGSESPQSPREQLTAPTPRLPSPFRSQLANPQKASTSMPSVCFFYTQTKTKRAKASLLKKNTEVLRCVYISYTSLSALGSNTGSVIY